MNGLYYNVRVRVKGKNVDGRDYFGRGVADLLHGVKEYHSLNQATKEMGMAYSKAWRIVRQAEKTLGMPLLVRMGKNGSVLTPEGEKLLEVYEEAEKKAAGVVKDVFEKFYMPIGDNITITQENVDNFITDTEVVTLGNKTTVVRAILANGFEIVESSACVKEENYNEKYGAEICREHIKDKVWHMLGFLLQTAVGGIKTKK